MDKERMKRLLKKTIILLVGLMICIPISTIGLILMVCYDSVIGFLMIVGISTILGFIYAKHGII